MKLKFYSYFLVLLFLSLILNPCIPALANESQTRQIDTMILEFQGDSAVVLKGLSKKSADTYMTVTFDEITKVTVAEGVTRLPDGMFERFPNVEEIELPASLVDFESGMSFEDSYQWNYYERGFNSFYNSLYHLKSITVSENNQTYKSIDGVLYSRDGKTIICYPEGKTTDSYTIPDTVDSIKYPIYNKYLTKINFGNAINFFIYDFMEGDLPALTSIEVSSDSKEFYSIDGVLFRKDGKNLMYYPAAKGRTYSVPEGTEKINGDAFAGSSLENITLPDSLQIIESYAFKDTPIKKITLPESLTDLSRLAFWHTSITEILVDEENPVYASVDGVVYNKAKTLLHYWPEAKVSETLTFPDTLTELHLAAIPTLDKSESIVIPKSLSVIDYTEENQLRTVKLANGNTSFALKQGVLYTSNLTSIALYPNRNPVTAIVLPDSVTSLDWDMFTTENTTTSITLPKNLKSLKQISSSYLQSIYRCPGFYHLKEVKLAKGNKYFTSKNGILYSKDMTSLEWYPQNHPGKTYNIPDTVNKVAGLQLVHTANLTELYIPANCSMDIVLKLLAKGNEEPYHKIIWGSLSPKLTKITVSSKNKKLKSVDNVLYTKDGSALLLYPSGKKNKSFTVPKSVKTVNSMSYNPYLEELTLSVNTRKVTKTMESDTQEDSYGNYNPFLYFTALKSIRVPSGNPYFKAAGGVLYNKAGTILVSYPVASKTNTLKLNSKLKYIQCIKNLICGMNLRNIKISEHEYFVSKNGDLYYYDGVLFITPGSGSSILTKVKKNILLLED